MKKVGITVVAAVCVVLLCVGFYFMKNQRWFTGIERKSDGGSENQ